MGVLGPTKESTVVRLLSVLCSPHEHNCQQTPKVPYLDDTFRSDLASVRRSIGNCSFAWSTSASARRWGANRIGSSPSSPSTAPGSSQTSNGVKSDAYPRESRWMNLSKPGPGLRPVPFSSVALTCDYDLKRDPIPIQYAFQLVSASWRNDKDQ